MAFDTFLKSNIIIHNRWTEEYIKMIQDLNIISKENNKTNCSTKQTKADQKLQIH